MILKKSGGQYGPGMSVDAMGSPLSPHQREGK